MKQRHKWIATVLSLSLVTVGFGVAAKDVSEDDVVKAQSKVRDLLDRVNPTAPSVDDVRRVPVLPTAQEQGMQVNTAHATDPFAVAERVRQTSSNLGFDPNDGQNAQLLVFVSFSMPETSLNRIAVETAKAGGVMVLRGFVEDSLKKTVAASEKLTNLGAQLQINPQLFQQYAITSVPAYVVAKNVDDGSSCAGGTQCIDHLVLEGDTSLRSVLERMSSGKGWAITKVAGAKLAQLEGVTP
jgi:conjugal transfer pilus assembly protein TrbC